MRIGIDARFYGGEQSKGLGRYVQKLIEQLVRLDHSNHYVVFLQQEQFDQWSITAPNIEPVLAPYRWYSLSEQLYMPKKIRQARVDFMHFPHFNVPILYRGRFVATIHDLIIIHFPTERATTLGPILYAVKHFAGKMVMRHAAKHAEQLITVSEFSRQDIAKYYGLDPATITVTYEAADPVPLIPTQQQVDAVRTTYGITKPYLLYIGNAYPHKNLDIVLETMTYLRQQHGSIPWQFVFVGREDYFFNRLRTEASGRGLDSAAVFTGFVPDTDLPALYAGSMAYLFPSRYEGFGLPPLEAMQAGAPVLAANASCLPEILGDAALYFNPEDISAILGAIDRVAHSPDVRAQLIAAGHKQAQKFSWKTMARDTLAVYERLQTNTKQTRSD